MPTMLDDLIAALLRYMDQDYCTCLEEGACPPDCRECPFCQGHAAIEAIGYIPPTAAASDVQIDEPPEAPQ